MRRRQTRPQQWNADRPIFAIPLIVAAFLAPSVCGAQIVVGHVIDKNGRTPVEGALVVLIREDGGEEDGYLTNSVGRFRLQARSGGRFRLRAERLGYTTVISPSFDLASGQVHGMDLETSYEPISMLGIDVAGEERCVVRPEEGLEVALLWEEARKALRVQEWTEEEGLYEYQVSNYERELGPNARVVEAEVRETDVLVAQIPYRSLPVEELLTHGFIRPLEDGVYEFRAPDASVLLSDPFLDTHCFRLTEDPDLPGSVGVAIEPVEGTDLPDIEGTLWLERESAKLQFLEYRYTKVPYPGAHAAAGGMVEFLGLPNGTWIVSNWWIRMPQVTRFRWPGRRAINEYRVTSFKEDGGEVHEVYSAEQLLLREIPQGVLSGSVWDSTQGSPMPGAVVKLAGTSHSSTTDSVGRFSMMELPEGVYTAVVEHPRFDSLGVHPPGLEVEVNRDQVIIIDLSIPSIETLLASLCQGSDEEAGTVALVGTVRQSFGRDPIPKATVTIEWLERRYTREPVPGFEARPDTAIAGFDRVITDIDGRFVFCGLPPRTPVEITTTFLDHVGETTTVRGDPGQHVVQNLELPLPPGTLTVRTSTEGMYPAGERQGIQGRIVDPVTGNPVPNAEVTIRWTQGAFTKTEFTNDRGLFRILTPWVGTFTLEAEALGYDQVDSDSLRVEPGNLTVVNVEMPPEPIDLDPLVVVAEPRSFHLEVSGFYERADQGFGHFITPDDMAVRQPIGFGDLLRGIPGLSIFGTPFGTQVLFNKPSATRSGEVEPFCQPRIYLDGVLISQPSPFNDSKFMGAYPDQVANVGDIAGMEVHTRFTGIPLAYGGTQGSCGVILIWTKSGGWARETFSTMHQPWPRSQE